MRKRRSAQQRQANRWLKMLDIDLMMETMMVITVMVVEDIDDDHHRHGFCVSKNLYYYIIRTSWFPEDVKRFF